MRRWGERRKKKAFWHANEVPSWVSCMLIYLYGKELTSQIDPACFSAFHLRTFTCSSTPNTKKMSSQYHRNIWLDKRGLINFTSDNPIIPETCDLLRGSGTLFIFVLVPFWSWTSELVLTDPGTVEYTYVTSTNMVFDRQVSKEQWRRHHGTQQVFFASINVILIFSGHCA